MSERFEWVRALGNDLTGKGKTQGEKDDEQTWIPRGAEMKAIQSLRPMGRESGVFSGMFLFVDCAGCSSAAPVSLPLSGMGGVGVGEVLMSRLKDQSADGGCIGENTDAEDDDDGRRHC